MQFKLALLALVGSALAAPTLVERQYGSPSVTCGSNSYSSSQVNEAISNAMNGGGGDYPHQVSLYSIEKAWKELNWICTSLVRWSLPSLFSPSFSFLLFVSSFLPFLIPKVQRLRRIWLLRLLLWLQIRRIPHHQKRLHWWIPRCRQSRLWTRWVSQRNGEISKRLSDWYQGQARAKVEPRERGSDHEPQS